MVPLLLATGFSFTIVKSVEAANRDAQYAAVGFFLIVYTAVYSPGAGVLPPRILIVCILEFSG